MRKYVFLLPSLNGGGAELVLINLANYLSRNNDVILFLINPDGNHKGRITQDVRLIVSKSKRSRGAYFELISLIRKEQPCALLACLVYPITIVGVLKFLGLIKCRVICRISNQIDMDVFSVKSFAMGIFYKFSITKFNEIVVQNDVMRQQVAELKPKSPITKILNPVTTADSTITVSQRKNFIWVGRLTDQKNYELLFEASKKVVHPINVYAKLYENVDFQQRVKLSQNSMLRLNNFSPDVKNNMSTARALIITSKYEGLPNVMLEALSVGTPVITSYYLGGGHELLDSTNSRYYKDADELSEILNNFNDADFDAEQIIEKIKKRCSIDIIAKKYEEVFNG